MLKTFKVRLIGKKRPTTVVAEYMRIDDNGVLWFRNQSVPYGGYPEMVRCFARGVWQDVEAQNA